VLHRIVAAVLLAVTIAAPAQAAVRIKSSPGGQIGPYLMLFAMVKQSGENVIIDGPCMSACTLVLSVVPRERICVTGRAVLGFHAAWTPDRRGRALTSHEATRLMLATYPASVRAWIQRRGGLTRRAIFLHGRELAAMYPRCA
jgi:hypothetical protein